MTAESIKANSKVRYYFNLSQGINRPRVILFQKDFVKTNEKGENLFEDEVITYSVCYGYSGGGVQADFLFKNDESDIISYSDCSGGQWNGTREYSSETNSYSVESNSSPWNSLDQKAYDDLIIRRFSNKDRQSIN